MYFTSKNFEEKKTGQSPLNFTSKSIESIRQNSNPTGYKAPKQASNWRELNQGTDLSQPTYGMSEARQAPPVIKKPSLLSKLKGGLNNASNYLELNDIAKQVGNIQNKKIDELTKSKLGSFEIGAINSAGLGIGERVSKAISPNLPSAYQQAKENNPIPYSVGEFAGYLAPGIGGTKLAKPLTNFATKKIASRLGKQVIEGAIVGSGLDVTQGVIAGDNIGQLGKRVVTGALLGAGADVGLNTIGKYAPKVIKSALPDWKVTHESKLSDNLKPIDTQTFRKHIEPNVSQNVVLSPIEKSAYIKKLINEGLNNDEIISRFENDFGTSTGLKGSLVPREGLLRLPEPSLQSKLETTLKENNINPNFYRKSIQGLNELPANNNAIIAGGYKENTPYYHGSPAKFKEFDSSKTGGLINLSQDEATAYKYASGGGGGRSGIDDANAYVVDIYDNVFEKRKGKWINIGKSISDDGKPLEIDRTKITSSPMNDIQANSLISNDEAFVLNKNPNIMKLQADIKNTLDLTNKDGINILTQIDSQGNQLVQNIINNAKDGSFDWGDTKHESATKIWQNIINPQLEKQGYDSIKFLDDNGEYNPTTAVFNSKQLKPYEATTKVKIDPKQQNWQGIPKTTTNKLEPILKPLQVTQKLSNTNTPLKANNVTVEPKTELNPSIGATDRTKLSVGIVTGENQAKTSFKDKIENAYSRIIDTNTPIKNKISEDAHVLATNSKKVSGTVGHIVSNELVDMKGNKIGESLSNISKDIPKNEEADFINYVLQKHNIDRAREGKPVDPLFTSEQSAKATSLIEQQKPQYKALSERLNKFLNTFEGEWGNKSGLVSDELWTDLQAMYKNYVPTQRGFSELEQGIAKTQGRGFVGQDNALNKAKGSDRDVINPIENIIKLVDRTVRTARYNEVGQSMVEAIRKNPSISKYAEILADDFKVNPNVNNIVTVLEKGKEINVQINDKNLLEALQGLYKSVDLNVAERGAKAFNNVFKSLITTKNPVFAFRNIARDLPTGYINGSENNPVKYLYDWVRSIGDLTTNSKVAQTYRALGGESSNFVNSDKTFKSANQIMNRKLKTDEFGQITGSKAFNPIYKGLKFVGDKLEAINNATESAPRLAEFKRTLQKTGDVQKALYASGEITTNFSRGGDLTKKLDNVLVPYLNAGVQGLDKLARQLDPRKPKQMLGTLIRGGVGIGAPTVVFHYMNQGNPNYDQLDNRTKDSYFLIPNNSDLDDKGNAKTFIKIPKAREYGVLFSTLFQRLERVSKGEENALKGFGNTVATNFSPTNPIESNIASPLLNLKANKDFANRNIIPQGMLSNDTPKYLQFDERSSEITKKIAELANKGGIKLSPKQMDYLIKSYTGVIGQLGLPATTKSIATGNTLSKLTKPVTTQFVSDPLYSNQAVTDFYDNLKKTSEKATEKNILGNLNPKIKTIEEQRKSMFTKAQSEISDLNKEIKVADAKNDTVKVKELRKKIIDISKATNDKYNIMTKK